MLSSCLFPFFWEIEKNDALILFPVLFPEKSLVIHSIAVIVFIADIWKSSRIRKKCLHEPDPWLIEFEETEKGNLRELCVCRKWNTKSMISSPKVRMSWVWDGKSVIVNPMSLFSCDSKIRQKAGGTRIRRLARVNSTWNGCEWQLMWRRVNEETLCLSLRTLSRNRHRICFKDSDLPKGMTLVLLFSRERESDR